MLLRLSDIYVYWISLGTFPSSMGKDSVSLISTARLWDGWLMDSLSDNFVSSQPHLATASTHNEQRPRMTF